MLTGGVDITLHLFLTQNVLVISWTPPEAFSTTSSQHNDPLTRKERHQIPSVSLCEEPAMKLRQSQPLFVDCFAALVADVGAKGENI